MARLQIGFADSVKTGSFSLPIRLTPIDLPLTSATTPRARAWARDLVGLLGALGYTLGHIDDDKQTEVKFKGFFIRVRA